MKIRSLVIGVIALATSLMAAASASALTVTPNGTANPYSASSGTTTLTATSIGSTLTCTASQFTGIVISASGTGSIPNGNAVYRACSSGILGPFTVTQTSAWPINVSLTTGSVALNVTVPTGGVVLRSVASGCSFSVAGVVTLLRTVSGLPAAINSGSVIRDSLAVTSNTGGVCAAFPAGLAADYAGTYALSPTATVSG